MTEQRGGDWVKTATPEQIVTAQQAGELVTYLGGQTIEEQAQESMIAGASDRVRAAAYGLRGGDQLRSNGSRDSTWYAKKRAEMDDGQRAQLEWVEQATPAEIYEAERSGDLDHLLGRQHIEAAVVAQEGV